MGCPKAQIRLASLILAFAALIVAAQARSAYNIVPRSAERRMQATADGPAASPTVISFDGDLDRIVELALARANGEFDPGQASPSVPNASPSVPSPAESPTLAPDDLSTSMTDPPTPGSGPGKIPVALSSNTCEGAIMNRLVVATWEYTIETVPGVDPDMVIGEVEETLQEALVPMILECNNPDVEDISIVAVDGTLPRDQISDDTFCVPDVDPLNNCTAVDGQVRIFLSDPGAADEALALTEEAIEIAVNSEDFVDKVPGLIKIIILHDSGRENPPASAGGDGDGNDSSEGGSSAPSISSGETGFGAISFVIMAIGGAALIAFVGSVYYWRHGNSDTDGLATQAAGTSTVVDSHDGLTAENPPSPFSEMLPRAYRFNDSMSILSGHCTMSPVIEGDDNSLSRASSVSNDAASESSVYTADAVHPDDSLTTLADTPQRKDSPELLGARKRAGGDQTAGLHYSDMISVNSNADGEPTSPPDEAMVTPESKASMPLGDLLVDTAGEGESPDTMDEDEYLLFDNEQQQHVVSNSEEEKVEETARNNNESKDYSSNVDDVV